MTRAPGASPAGRVSAAGVSDIGAELLQVPEQPSEPLIGQAAGVSLSVRPTGQYHRPDVPGPTPEGRAEQSGDHVHRRHRGCPWSLPVQPHVQVTGQRHDLDVPATALSTAQAAQRHDRLPDDLGAVVDQRTGRAHHADTALAASAQLEALARALQRTHPGAAGSLREGLEETLTVLRLNVPPSLARTLRSTTAIESMISIARTTPAT